MFKIIVPITKSFEKDSKVFVVEGIASDPSIDRDEERFDEEALKRMSQKINGSGIPIRVEHENKIYTEIGKWTKAEMRGDKLYVKGELDTELSLGKDMATLLKRGEQLALSVGGKVLDASYEFIKDLDKRVKVYKDVDLMEISLVKNPSNYNTSLTMAKSVNWDKTDEVEYTTQAQKMIEEYKKMQKVSVEEFVEKACKGKKKKTQAEILINAYKNMEQPNDVEKKPSKGQAMIDEGTAMIEEGKKIFGGKSGKGLKMVEEGQAMIDAGKKMLSTEKTDAEIVENAVNKYFDEDISDEDLEKEFDALSDEQFELVDKAIDEEEESVTKYGKPGRSGRKPSGNKAKDKWRKEYRSRRKDERTAFYGGRSARTNRLFDRSDIGIRGGYTRRLKSVNWQDFKDIVNKAIDEEITKDYDEVEVSCTDSDKYMTMEDVKMIAKLTAILSQVELPEDGSRPKELDDSEWYSKLTEEQQIVLWNRNMVYPHHNEDLSLNEDLLLYQLKDAVNSQNWWKPKDFTAIIDHLYRHLKELKFVKSAKNITNQNGDMDKPEKQAPEVTKEVTTPEEAEVAEVVTPEVPPSEVKVEESPAPAGEVVEETPADAVVEEAPKEEEAPVVEEEVPASAEEPQPTEEVPAEAPEPVTEEAEEPVAPVEEPVVEEPATPVVEETPAEEVTKSVMVEKAALDTFEKSLSNVVNVVETLAKKYEAVEAVSKSVDTVSKKLEDMEALVTKQSQIIDKLAEIPMRRKSVAIYSAIEKAFSADEKSLPEDALVEKTMQEEGCTFTEAYKKVLATKRA